MGRPGAIACTSYPFPILISIDAKLRLFADIPTQPLERVDDNVEHHHGGADEFGAGSKDKAQECPKGRFQ